MLNISLIKSMFICVIFFSSFAYTWASGVPEEKYYIILDHPFTYHSRMLEKALYDVARERDTSIVIHYPQKHDFKNKLSILKIGIDQKFPVLIFQHYEPEIVSTLTDIYYKNGEFTSTGYMGSFIFLETAQADDSPISLQLPWKLYNYDTKYIASEIAEAITTVSQQSTNDTTDNIQLLYVTDTISDGELTFGKDVMMKLVNPDTIPQDLTPLQFTIETNTETITNNINIVFTAFATESNASNNTRIENATSDTSTEIFDMFINALEQGRTNIIITLNENITDLVHSLIRTHYASLNSVPPPYHVISWGANPEYHTQNKDNNIILSFEVDYQAYAQQIMNQAAVLYNNVMEYVFTDEMIVNKNAIQSFSSESTIIPVKSIRYYDNTR